MRTTRFLALAATLADIESDSPDMKRALPPRGPFADRTLDRR
jgi:hypothetical protein